MKQKTINCLLITQHIIIDISCILINKSFLNFVSFYKYKVIITLLAHAHVRQFRITVSFIL